MISPNIMTTPVLHIVSHATRLVGSRATQASTTASEIVSHSLSGWDSVTPSEVKRKVGVESAVDVLDAAGEGGASVMVVSVAPAFGASVVVVTGASVVSAVDMIARFVDVVSCLGLGV